MKLPITVKATLKSNNVVLPAKAKEMNKNVTMKVSTKIYYTKIPSYYGLITWDGSTLMVS